MNVASCILPFLWHDLHYFDTFQWLYYKMEWWTGCPFVLDLSIQLLITISGISWILENSIRHSTEYSASKTARFAISHSHSCSDTTLSPLQPQKYYTGVMSFVITTSDAFAGQTSVNKADAATTHCAFIFSDCDDRPAPLWRLCNSGAVCRCLRT